MPRLSRQSIRNWIVRYEQGGLVGLATHSRRPDNCPHQISAEIEALIRECAASTRLGPRRIEHQFGRIGVDPVPVARASTGSSSGTG